MSLILKGIDLPEKGKVIKLEIEEDGTVWIDGKEWECYGLSAIQIPKGHGRLIDADEVFCYNFWDEQNIGNAPMILEAEE